MITVDVSEDFAKVDIKLTGSFDFGIVNEFREAYEKGKPQFSEFVLHLDQVDHMDSSALGMLLQIKEYAGDVPVIIKVSKEEILDILRISNFAKLFTVTA